MLGRSTTFDNYSLESELSDFWLSEFKNDPRLSKWRMGD
jgi:hypothetical protein